MYSVHVTLRRVWLALVLGCALAGAAACDLNPQPEVPSGAAAAAGAGAFGGSTGTGGFGGGAGGGAGVGIGGTSSGGSGATSGFGGSAGTAGSGTGGGTGVTDCLPACKASEVCNVGKCVDDPCDPNSCSAKQACKPNADFTAAGCFDSCASVNCNAGEQCDDGNCESTGCSVTCNFDEVCMPQPDAGYACVPDPCASDGGPLCGANQACDPMTLMCVPDPCIGVKCPSGQECNAGQCVYSSDAGADAGADSGSTDASGD